jgi:hypothetical protein
VTLISSAIAAVRSCCDRGIACMAREQMKQCAMNAMMNETLNGVELLVHLASKSRIGEVCPTRLEG